VSCMSATSAVHEILGQDVCGRRLSYTQQEDEGVQLFSSDVALSLSGKRRTRD
jgi:hypothetical protein